MGALELMFLFAPLVIAPLGIELSRVLGGSGRLLSVAQRLQPIGGALAVAAMWLPPGGLTGRLALGWMAVCALVAAEGLCNLLLDWWSRTASIARATLCIAKIDLAVGGAWLVASRWGMKPIGIQEPIGLLTAVHFHYAGFALATIAAATLTFATLSGEHRWLKYLTLVVAGMPFLVAAGFVLSPAFKMGAGVVFSASVAGLAIFVRAFGTQAKDATARFLLQAASIFVFAGMVFSAAYAIADYAGSDVLPIPQMARTHGIFNAIGFCLPALLGWLAELSQKHAGDSPE